MKRCPQCNKQFADEYSFCLDDGTVLVSDFAGYQDAPTQVISPPVITKHNVPKSTSPLIYVLFGVLATALAGTVYMLVFRNDDPQRNAQQTNTNVVIPTSSPTTAEVRTSSQSATPNPQPRQIDVDAIKNEISQTISAWKTAGENRDLASTMSYYAETINYYRRGGASKNFVRTDKQKYYDKFHTATVSISNLVTVPSNDGERVTATFDKEWIYDGSSNFSGKVKQELKFRRIDGRWLIVGERDAHVYYLNK